MHCHMSPRDALQVAGPTDPISIIGMLLAKHDSIKGTPRPVSKPQAPGATPAKRVSLYSAGGTFWFIVLLGGNARAC